jgi:hypothetical protein
MMVSEADIAPNPKCDDQIQQRPPSRRYDRKKQQKLGHFLYQIRMNILITAPL